MPISTPWHLHSKVQDDGFIGLRFHNDAPVGLVDETDFSTVREARLPVPLRVPKGTRQLNLVWDLAHSDSSLKSKAVFDDVSEPTWKATTSHLLLDTSSRSLVRLANCKTPCCWQTTEWIDHNA